MKIKNIIASCFIILSTQAFGQWEYQYFVARLGLVHGIMNSQPATSSGRYVVTAAGEIPLTTNIDATTGFYLPYVVNANADLFFHMDAKNDKFGAIIGASFSMYPSVQKYATKNNVNWVVERLDVLSVGLPVYVKFSKEMYEKQQYFYTGFVYNFNLELFQTQKVSWSQSNLTLSRKEALKKSTVALVAGYNHLLFNIELNYIPSTFIDPKFTLDGKLYPYESEPKNKLFLKTGITVPLSKWTTSRNYFLHKFFRRFRR
ncbi:MAG TPA: hypothetical protein DCQ31_02745 [Bacteroidales bacterium]|nr:hypothetical protein [Bacteroidales bacterium]